MSEPASVVIVRVEPLGETVEVRPGESLMRAAERQGLWWPTLCHGQAECTACWIDASGLDAFEPASALEESGLGLFEGRTFFDGKDVRLACQARPVRDSIVVKRGVRRPS